MRRPDISALKNAHGGSNTIIAPPIRIPIYLMLILFILILCSHFTYSSTQLPLNLFVPKSLGHPPLLKYKFSINPLA